MVESIKTMKAVFLTKADTLEVRQVPIPKPGPGEVLIKVEASPINPSDLAFLKGVYGSRKKLPCIPGFEGSGTIVENGGGLYGWTMVGKRVSFASNEHSEYGSWAEYTCTNATMCSPIDPKTSFVQGSCSIVNPLSVYCMLEVVNKENVKVVVHTAAASALGRMMNRYFK